MPKRPRTIEEKKELAKLRGYQDDIDDVDNEPVPDDVEECTREQYEIQLNSWFE